MENKKVKSISCDVEATIEVVCPHCDNENIFSVSIGPYTPLVGDDGEMDEVCQVCKKLFTIDFFD